MNETKPNGRLDFAWQRYVKRCDWQSVTLCLCKQYVRFVCENCEQTFLLRMWGVVGGRWKAEIISDRLQK